MSTTILEREIKLRFSSAERSARGGPRDRRDAAATAGGCRKTALLDTEDEQLRRRGCVLRVRMENGKSRLTSRARCSPRR